MLDNYKPFVEKTDWNGEPALRFGAGGYEAMLIPGIGGNLVKLKDIKRGLDIMRMTEDLEAFKARPQVYGLPVLFPPNRIEDGTFKAAGMVYNFPVNEEANHNHIHGFLRTRKFEVTKMEAYKDSSEVEIIFNADKNTEFYAHFPHEFLFRILYILSSKGLEQKVTIINNSERPMPMGLGFHTAFNVPFCSDSKAEDCRMMVSVGEEWELNQRILPTGKILPLSEKDKKYREGGIEPQGYPISGHYTVKPINVDGSEFHGAIIEDKSKGLRLVYEVGEGFKQWMIWNMTGDKGFICPEPQTWAVNAPNINLPDEVTGFLLLSPGEVWEEHSRVYIQEVK